MARIAQWKELGPWLEENKPLIGKLAGKMGLSRMVFDRTIELHPDSDFYIEAEITMNEMTFKPPRFEQVRKVSNGGDIE
jgi:hypothetical protein